MLAHIFTWLFVFAVPWQNVIVIPGLGTISRAFGAAALVAALGHVVLTGRLRPLLPFHVLAVIYFCWIFLSAFWGIAKQTSVLIDVMTNLQLFVMVWIIWEAAPTRARFASLLQAYVLGAYVAAGNTILNYLRGAAIQAEVARFSATGFDANDLGMTLALALPMAWYLASTASDGLRRWLNRAYFIVGILAILLTSSRGALLAALMALAIIPFTVRQLRPATKVAMVVIGLGAAVLAVQLVPEKSFERLATTGQELSEGTMNNRLRIWKEGLKMVPRRPLQGVGPAGWFPAVGQRIGNMAPHSSWLAILVEEGIVGLLLYVSLFLVTFLRLRRLPSTLDRRVGLGLLATLMLAISPLGWHQHKAAWVTLALLAVWSKVLWYPTVPEIPAAPVPPGLRRPLRPVPRAAAR